MMNCDLFINKDEFHFAAVIVPIITKEERPYVLFEVRAGNISQPGEVCFPGGHIKPGETPLAAALRETSEELLISPEQIHNLAPVGILPTPSGRIICAYSGELFSYSGTYSPREVSHTFQVPLSFFLEKEPETYFCKTRVEPEDGFPFSLLPGGRDYSWKRGRYPVFFYQYENHIIWGMTAKILREYVRQIQLK